VCKALKAYNNSSMASDVNQVIKLVQECRTAVFILKEIRKKNLGISMQEIRLA
jgi:hypothetical protein